MKGPLTGLRVLDIATIIAAPSAAALLGDYGADVVKIELPGQGDGARAFPPLKDGKALWWKVTNRNKRFVTLDFRQPEGRDMLLRMLPHFDVLIENFRPGTLDRWGLDRDTLWGAQPSLTILRVSGFGQTGPYKDRAGFARIFEAMGGLTYISGEPDGEPMHTGYPIGDSIGGLFGAVGVLAALWARSANPDAPGEEIDLSLTEAMLKLMEFLPAKYKMLGEVHERSGNTSQYSAPAAVYATKDGRWVSLSGSTNALYANNCRAIGRPDLIDDPRFCSNPLRARHADALNAIFAAWCAEHDLEPVLSAFHAAHGTIAPIYSADQICNDPHFQARGILKEVPDEDFGSICMADAVPRFRRNPGGVRVAASGIGRHNAEVYGEMLALDEDELTRLAAKGVI